MGHPRCLRRQEHDGKPLRLRVDPARHDGVEHPVRAAHVPLRCGVRWRGVRAVQQEAVQDRGRKHGEDRCWKHRDRSVHLRFDVGQVEDVEDRATETEWRKRRGEDRRTKRWAATGGWLLEARLEREDGRAKNWPAGLRWDDGSWRRTEFGWQKCQLY